MTRALAALLVMSASLMSVARAQTVRFHLEGVGLTYQEFEDGRQAVGAGGGGGIEVRVWRVRLDVRAYSARLELEGDGTDFNFAQVDVRASYPVSQFLSIEVGGGRRYVDPAFATQEVGVIRIGVLSENQLTSLASVWVRGAYLADPRFSGGGSSDLAFEFGLGVGMGTANGRFRVQAEYEFQRIDREVSATDVPIQMSLARAGIAFGF